MKLNTKLLLTLGAHIGHSKIDWNTNNNSYLIGLINNKYLIFNINKTLFYLKKAGNLFKLVAFNNGTFLVYYPGKTNFHRLLIEGGFDKEGLLPDKYPFVHSIVKPGFFSNWRMNYKKLLNRFYKVIFYNPFFFAAIITKEISLSNLKYAVAPHQIKIQNLKNLIEVRDSIKKYYKDYIKGLRIFRKTNEEHPHHLLEVKNVPLSSYGCRKKKKRGEALQMYSSINQINVLLNKLKATPNLLISIGKNNKVSIKVTKKVAPKIKNLSGENLSNNLYKNYPVFYRKKSNKFHMSNLLLYPWDNNNKYQNFLKKIFLKNQMSSIEINKSEKINELRVEYLKILYYNLYNLILMSTYKKMKYGHNNNDDLTPYEQNYFKKFVRFMLIFRYMKRLQTLPTLLMLINPEQDSCQNTDFKSLNTAVVGLTDSNSFFDSLSYFIPTSDDNIILILYYIKVLGKFFNDGKKSYILSKMLSKFHNNIERESCYDFKNIKNTVSKNLQVRPFLSPSEFNHMWRLKKKDKEKLKGSKFSIEKNINKSRYYQHNRFMTKHI